jgi:HAE1 family hydrophobic/amphiphilic exporter-1
MFAMPQTFVGVILSLVITGRTLNVPAFIGIIMLAGIVVNNAIVLVDYINKLRERGYSCRDAILQAGPVRLRPILMTTLTTVLGMFPMALGFGSGAETYSPLATVVIGGLLTSTLLTLLVVPVIYSILDDWGERIRQRRKQPISGEVLT